MKLALKPKAKAVATKVGNKVKDLGSKAKEKAKAVDWKKVGNAALKVGWELTKLGITIAIDLAR